MARSEPPRLRAHARALGAASLILIACAKPKAAPPTPTPTPTPNACDPNRTALRLVMHDDLPVRAFVPVVKDGAVEYLLFDTGSEHTHLRGDAPAFVEVACRRAQLGAIAGSPIVPGPDGRDIIGIAGADEITRGVTEVDLRAGTPAIIHHARVPNEVTTWTKIAVADVRGFVVTNAEVDGRPMRLLVDTGTDALLVIDRDVVEDSFVESHDAFGNALRMVARWAMLRWDTEQPRRVRSWRMRSHPAFEAHAKQLGGADGILGLATLGARRVVFDVKNGALYLR